jgi:hypothetical protein
LGGYKQFARDLATPNLGSFSNFPTVSSHCTRKHHPLTHNDINMAAFFKAVNAKIRANPMLSYVCSTRTFAS